MKAINIATTVTSAIDHLPDLNAKKLSIEFLDRSALLRIMNEEIILEIGNITLNKNIKHPTKMDS